MVSTAGHTFYGRMFKMSKKSDYKPKGLILPYPGILCFDYFTQSMWEDLSEYKEGGLEFVKDVELHIRTVDQHGDPLCFKHVRGGGVSQSFGHNGAYHSAAGMHYRL